MSSPIAFKMHIVRALFPYIYWYKAISAFIFETVTQSTANNLVHLPIISATPQLVSPNPQRRQHSLTTCGFANGDPSKPRTANLGFVCRIDTQHGLWGFCPTTVISATDCGLAGNCVDSNTCSNGCGIVGTPGIITFIW